MDTLIDELKSHARILQRSVQSTDPAAIARIHAAGELIDLDAAEVAARIQRRHCLAVIARELGFKGWPHLVAILEGDEITDYGTLLYPDGADVHWNIWCASYAEARAIREEHGGFLLAYRRHFFIVDRHFIVTLGLNPDDPDWDRMGRDWARPRSLEARVRLYQQLIRQRSAPGCGTAGDPDKSRPGRPSHGGYRSQSK